MPWCLVFVMGIAMAFSAVPARGDGQGASTAALWAPYAERVVLALEKIAEATDRQARTAERQRDALDRLAREVAKCR